MTIKKYCYCYQVKFIPGMKFPQILGQPNVFPVDLIEKLSILTAQQFEKYEIEYIDGDYIMNNIYNYWYSDFPDAIFGDIVQLCFDAFDEGEFIHLDDDSEIDPSEKYTRPLIAELLNRIDSHDMFK